MEEIDPEKLKIFYRCAFIIIVAALLVIFVLVRAEAENVTQQIPIEIRISSYTDNSTNQTWVMLKYNETEKICLVESNLSDTFGFSVNYTYEADVNAIKNYNTYNYCDENRSNTIMGNLISEVSSMKTFCDKGLIESMNTELVKCQADLAIGSINKTQYDTLALIKDDEIKGLKSQRWYYAFFIAVLLLALFGSLYKVFKG